jgi:hypothetical protein
LTRSATFRKGEFFESKYFGHQLGRFTSYQREDDIGSGSLSSLKWMRHQRIKRDTSPFNQRQNCHLSAIGFQNFSSHQAKNYNHSIRPRQSPPPRRLRGMSRMATLAQDLLRVVSSGGISGVSAFSQIHRAVSSGFFLFRDFSCKNLIQQGIFSTLPRLCRVSGKSIQVPFSRQILSLHH